MSQTPTKGPYSLGHIQTNVFDAGGMRVIRCDLDGDTYHPDAIRMAEFVLDCLNIHDETKQTPRQILESREALRAALEEIDATPIPMVQCPDTLKFVLRQIGKIASKALTLAKEGGPK